MSGSSDYASRIDRARAAMADQNLPALLITQIDNVGWISGFRGSTGYVFLTPAEAVFATDSRYTSQAAAQCPDFKIEKLATSSPDEITGLLSQLHMPRVGFESSHLTYKMHAVYREKLPAEIEFVPTEGIIENLRLIKDAGELAKIEAAVVVADKAWEHILPFLKPGAVERDVMLELEWFMRRQFGADVAFDTIVASGPRAALPHGRASDRVMQQGDFVTLDFGARLDGYCSDITRTVVLGKASDEQKKVYGTVREALYRSIEGVKPGMGGKEVDAIARDHIKEAGYGDYFGHGLGHSLGRAVHDGQGFSVRSELTTAAGMVITVEPGIYIPDWGGVRIEHDIVITENGAHILDQSPTELLEL
jgi:Xaa-Pro aminopeptidase